MPTLFIVPTPLGNLSDLSPRARDVLSSVGRIAAEDTRVSGKLLSLLGIDTPMVSYQKFTERQKAAPLIAQMLEKNEDMALVTDAGTPCICDPGAILVAEAADMGVTIIALPGPNAGITALSGSGFDGAKHAFLGFFPRTSGEAAALMTDMAQSLMDVFIFYESPHRVQKTAQMLCTAFPQADAVFCREISKLHETHYRGRLEDILTQLQNDPNAEKGEYTLVVHRNAPPIRHQGASALCPEAFLVQAIYEKALTLEEAMTLAREQGFARNALYKAQLNLKKMFGEEN